MTTTAPFVPPRPEARGAERRRERRYQVDLPGTLRLDEAAPPLPVLASDLSASGALVAAEGLEARLAPGARATLLLDEFGALEAQVAHLGRGFCGLRFLHPHLHRDRLSAWLRGEVGTGADAAG